jgi:hypothetical protein
VGIPSRQRPTKSWKSIRLALTVPMVPLSTPRMVGLSKLRAKHLSTTGFCGNSVASTSNKILEKHSPCPHGPNGTTLNPSYGRFIKLFGLLGPLEVWLEVNGSTFWVFGPKPQLYRRRNARTCPFWQLRMDDPLPKNRSRQAKRQLNPIFKVRR